MPLDLIRPALIAVFALLVIFAAIRDLTSYTIPNWISLALAGAFLPAALAAGVSWPDIGWSALVGVGMLAIGVGMFALRWIGGGDAKVMAAASLWLGLPALPHFAFYTALSGGALALMLLAMRSAWLRPLAVGGPAWIDRLATPGGATPYGVAIAVGALLAFPEGIIFRLTSSV